MKVKDFYEDIICFGSEETLVPDILKCWIKSCQSVFCVIDKDNKIIGILTLYDILKIIIPFYFKIDKLLIELINNNFQLDEKIKKISKIKAKNIMTKDVITVNENDSVFKAMAIMYTENLDYLPVINASGLFTKKVISRNTIEEAIIEMLHNGK